MPTPPPWPQAYAEVEIIKPCGYRPQLERQVVFPRMIEIAD